MSKTNPFAPKSTVVSAEVEVEVESEPVVQVVVPSGSIAEIKRWVTTDKERAALALEKELNSDSPRVTLVSYLEDLLAE